MTFHEVNLNEEVLDLLIRFSEDWAAENSCYGYRPNDKSDIEGNRIFFAEDGNTVIGYLFGKVYQSEQMKSIMPEGTPCFEVEELYIVPGRRSQGVGAKLFRYTDTNLALKHIHNPFSPCNALNDFIGEISDCIA